MKRNKYHIILTWLLLTCFATGQFVVYAHQHTAQAGTHISTRQNQNTQPKQTLTENCQLCGAMIHNTMAVNSIVYFAPVAVTGFTHKTFQYNFISIALILSAGRSPPVAYSC